ncbi:conjugative transposon protein TraM [Flavitalea sp. BT771]|uniref:conjugative transposon protein TraM n=1 Tax=Flavitalea sp. BT771 TaxID=3063329 RepID=UPI0026E3A7B7|nr:conjugative transposon protein TraM [Flavitalea sp. BT771]MDO6431570.1 conjugative transposon protein TraM [Flavitalea sp. BT771]MDV6220478.1 conjugative transposon protein TraM [Flavitalea sp. BT771]
MEKMRGKYNETYLRKRKMLLVVPVILIPMITLGFYGLGGGKGGKGGVAISVNKGLNMSLPDARFDAKRKNLNKLGFYKQSEQDSLKIKESRKMDPYYAGEDTVARWRLSSSARNDSGLSSKSTAGGGLFIEHSATDAQAGALLNKLDQLKGVLNRQEQEAVPGGMFSGRVPEKPVLSVGGGPATSYAVTSGREAPGDPDLDKLNTLMDKVLKVRYPSDPPLLDSAVPAREDRPVQVLATPPSEEMVTTLPLDESAEGMETGFIELDEGKRVDSLASPMITAVVDGAQTLVPGESVSLRIAQEAVVGGVRVPRGTAMAGKASLSGERLLVSVNSIRLGNQVVPVALDVIDMDGMPGFHVKGSINRDVSKESADQAVSSLGMTTLDPGVAGQATAAGLQAARTLLSRKVRLVRVGLPAGYKVLLRNTKLNR